MSCSILLIVVQYIIDRIRLTKLKDGCHNIGKICKENHKVAYVIFVCLRIIFSIGLALYWLNDSVMSAKFPTNSKNAKKMRFQARNQNNLGTNQIRRYSRTETQSREAASKINLFPS